MEYFCYVFPWKFDANPTEVKGVGDYFSFEDLGQEKRKRQSCNARNWFAKKKTFSQRANGTHPFSALGQFLAIFQIFWVNVFWIFSQSIFFCIFSPLCRLNSDWCLHFTDGRGWISVEGSCKYDCQSTLWSFLIRKTKIDSPPPTIKLFLWNLRLQLLSPWWGALENFGSCIIHLEI